MNDYIQRVADAVRDACRELYSPDDSWRDWDDKMIDLDLSVIIDRVTPDAPSWLTDGQIMALWAKTVKDEGDVVSFARAIEQRVRGGQDSVNDGSALYIAREALWYYADGEHFVRHEPEAWDTVSGEPINFYEDEANTATVEDGSIAKQALETIAGAKHLAPPPAVPDVMYVWPAMEARQVLTEYGMTENEAIDVEYRLRSLIRAQLSAAPRQEDQP